MASSPIQVVLNSSDFIDYWERSGGGEHKDFYEGSDREFVMHQSKLSSQLSILKAKQPGNRFSDVTYAKVVLKQSALAKSHRPTGSLFRKDVAPVIGAGDLGEFFVELQPSTIEIIADKILQAEPVTRYKVKDDGKKVANPSNLRSEVGAIDEIQPYTASDKRKFSVADAVKWILNPKTGGAYIIELFENPPVPQDLDSLSPQKRKLFQSFSDGLLTVAPGLVARKIWEKGNNAPMLALRVTVAETQSVLQLQASSAPLRKSEFEAAVSQDLEKHAALLKFLDEHPLVKKVFLPPIITKSTATATPVAIGSAHALPKRELSKSYPKLGVVDGGVSDVIGDWVIAKHGFLGKPDRDEDHGTFIAGLAVTGLSLNGTEICKEADGCAIVDVDILPRDGSWDDYYSDFSQFFVELDVAVKDVKAKTGVRIFNFSLNIEEHVSSEGYSLPAKWLDQIAEENDVIFVISAGNTGPNDARKEWPSDPVAALKILASSRNDTIKKPAESYRNLSVSAVNPPNLKGIVPYALSRYSCRGPGIRIGLKPDLAHIGGCGTKSGANGHGLLSIDGSGQVVDGCGTSYAAPNVGKTLASLENAIEGAVSRESLMALSIHNATVPDVMMDKHLKEMAKDLVGFGIPACADEILQGKDSQITLVFANRILPGRRMSFNFSWPASLVVEGKCTGYARLTLVSTPPFDYRFGAEFVRVNIEGHLRQQQDDGKYKGRLDPLYLPENTSGQLYEKNQIAHSFKWSPIKVFEKTFKKGVGPTTDWKLEIEYLTRDGETLPALGVPFTALLTIADPKGEKPVFNDMRQTLQSQGVKIVDIKTAARVVTRV